MEQRYRRFEQCIVFLIEFWIDLPLNIIQIGSLGETEELKQQNSSELSICNLCSSSMWLLGKNNLSIAAVWVNVPFTGKYACIESARSVRMQSLNTVPFAGHVS
jgi:hypothetical protein